MLRSTPATEERFALKHTPATEILADSPKKQFFKALLNPLWRITKTYPEKVFLNLSLIEEKINALLACDDETFLAEAAIFLEHFYKSQRRCLWFMDMQKPQTNATDLTTTAQNNDDDYHQYAPWIDVVKLTEHVLHWRQANAEIPSLMELKECNADILNRIEVCLTVVQPFTLTAIPLGEEKLETVIKRHEKAVDILSELKLASYEDVFYFAKNFMKYFDKTRLLHECVVIFGMPAQEAIEAFKRLFLTLQLLILIVLKALNQTSNNAMASSSEWIKFKRLIDEFVILNFAIENGEDIVGILSSAAFSQKNLLLSLLESESLMAELSSRNLHASSRRDRDCQLRSIGLVYISGYNKLAALITHLNANSVISDYKPALPDLRAYVLDVIGENRKFFHEHLIQGALYHLGLLQSDRELREKEFCSILNDSCKKIAPILEQMLSAQIIEPVLLQEFGFTQTINKIIIKQGEMPKQHFYIDIESLANFFNSLNQIELSDPFRKLALDKELIALQYLEIAFEYCIEYNIHLAAHEKCLSGLKDRICPPKPSASKTKSKPRKPDQPASPANISQPSENPYASFTLPRAEDQVMLKRQREKELQDLHRLIDQANNKNNELERNAASAKKGKITDKVFFPDFAQRAHDISSSITALAAKMKTTLFTKCNSQAIHAEIVQLEMKLTQLVANQRCAANYFYPKGEEKPAADAKDEALRCSSRPHAANSSFFKNGKPVSVAKQTKPTESKRHTP